MAGNSGRRPSRLAALAPQGDGENLFLPESLDELPKALQLLLDEIARGLVFDLAGLVVELGREIADEDFWLVERERVQKHQRLAQIVLHPPAAQRSGRSGL